MRAGRLRLNVDVIAPPEGVDSVGQPVDAGDPLYEDVAASVKFLSGREGRRGEQTEATATYEVRMRWRAGVTPAHTIVVCDTGERLAIESCGDPDGRRRELVCKCTQLVA